MNPSFTSLSTWFLFNVLQIRDTCVRVHETLHDGFKRGLSRVYQEGYCFGLATLFQELIKLCPHCVSSKGRPAEAPLRPIIRNEPNERWVFDLKDITHDPDTGHSILWVCIDAFSSYCWTRPVYGKTPACTAEALISVITDNGAPKELGMDNGNEFLDAVCQLVYAQLQIDIARGRARHPESQGKVEKVHQVIGNCLVDYARSHGGRWVENVEIVTAAHNTSVSSALGPGLTPFFVHRGYHPRKERDGVPTRLTVTPFPLHSAEVRREINARVHSTIVKRGLENIARHAKRRRVMVQQHKVGSVVKIRAPDDDRNGLAWRVRGVVRQANNYTYTVELLTAGFTAAQPRGALVDNLPHVRLLHVAASLADMPSQLTEETEVVEGQPTEDLDVYPVEYVFGRKTAGQETLYLTKWLNHPWTACTWQLFSSFTEDVQRALLLRKLTDFSRQLRTDTALKSFLQKLEGT